MKMKLLLQMQSTKLRMNLTIPSQNAEQRKKTNATVMDCCISTVFLSLMGRSTNGQA